MAKVFLSYPFTGEDLGLLEQLLTKIVNVLEANGNEVFCALLRKEKIDQLGIHGYDARLAYCLEQQLDADFVVAVILGETPSNGMQKELQLAKERNQPYLLFIKKELTYTDFRNYATSVIEYSSPEDIEEHLKRLIDENSDSLYSVVA